MSYVMNKVYEFIRNNHVLALCEEAFINKSLTLNLSRFDITELPQLMQQCELLFKLFLNHNKLATIPLDISCMTRLQILTLDYNCLEEFPSVICTLTTLCMLNISCNNIKHLPPEIGKLVKLETFWCNNTGLLDLPNEFTLLEKLKTFGARGNKLQYLPQSFGQLKNLLWLTLESNDLNELPDSFSELTALVHLNLRCNRLQKIPTFLTKLRQLKFVFLNDNNITEVPPEDMLMNTDYMKMLNLGNNPMSLELKNIIQQHVYYEERNRNDDQASPSSAIESSHNLQADVVEEDDTNLNEDEDSDDGSDWEHSVQTSDLDTTDDSAVENELEDLSVLLPELSRYITNFG